MDNYQQTVISQYAASQIINQMIADLNDYIDPKSNINAFYQYVWNVDTATGNGLAIWGRIVGVTNVVQVPVTPLFFGFREAIPGVVGFGQGPFWNGSSPLVEPYTISDDEFRLLILSKALANITNCSTPAINQILLNLFPGRGNAYVVDNLNMTMTYYFTFSLTQVEYAIVTQSGVLPRPAGVSASVVTN